MTSFLTSPQSNKKAWSDDKSMKKIVERAWIQHLLEKLACHTHMPNGTP